MYTLQSPKYVGPIIVIAQNVLDLGTCKNAKSYLRKCAVAVGTLQTQRKSVQNGKLQSRERCYGIWSKLLA